MDQRARLDKVARLIRAWVEGADTVAAAIRARVVAAAANIQDLATRPCSALRICWAALNTHHCHQLLKCWVGNRGKQRKDLSPIMYTRPGSSLQA